MFLGVGIAAGYLLRSRPGVARAADVGMGVLVVVLLFLLGLAAGQNPRVVEGLARLGARSVALGLAATAGSLALVVPLAGRLLEGSR